MSWSAFGRPDAARMRWLTDPRARRFASLEAFQAYVATGGKSEIDGFDRTDPEVHAFLDRTSGR